MAWLTLQRISPLLHALSRRPWLAIVHSKPVVDHRLAGLAALSLDREHALMHSLALAALVILAFSPQALFDITFQLSYLSVLVIGYVVLLLERS